MAVTEQSMFIRNRLLEDIEITVVSIEELVHVPKDGPFRIEKTGTKRFRYDNGEERFLRTDSKHYNQVVGDKVRKRTWNTLYAPTGNLSYIQEVLYGEEDKT